jgi:hypothetical protein
MEPISEPTNFSPEDGGNCLSTELTSGLKREEIRGKSE